MELGAYEDARMMNPYICHASDYSEPKPLEPFECEAVLLNSELWKEFHELGTEMIITKNGRCMFPVIAFRLLGLQDGVQYAVSVELRLLSGGRWSRNKGHWSPNSPTSRSSPILDSLETSRTGASHPLSPAPASLWSRPFKFNNLKLTNNRYDFSGNILLRSMHKYLPVLKVRRLGQDPAEKYFTFPETEFVAVTAYQNHDVARLKIDYNPYARGFRDSERRKNKMKTQEKDRKPLTNKTIPNDTISSGESSSSSPPLDVSTCDILTKDQEDALPRLINPAFISNDYWYMMAEWSRGMMVPQGYLPTGFRESSFLYQPVPQWRLAPTWHIPTAPKKCNENLPKGSSFTIRALLQNN